MGIFMLGPFGKYFFINVPGKEIFLVREWGEGGSRGGGVKALIIFMLFLFDHC